MDLPERIKVLLEKRGMTQKDLARDSRLTEAAVSRYLKGERIPRSPALAAMAMALNVSMDYLATGKETSDLNEIKAVLMRGAPNLNQSEIVELMGVLVDFAKQKEGDNGKNL